MPNLKRESRNVKLARKCLTLIRNIAGWGASSSNLNNVGYALQELSQVLLERTGVQDRYFEPIPAGEIENLAALYTELDFVGHMLPGPLWKTRLSLRAGHHEEVSKQKKPAAAGAGRARREAFDATG